MLTIPVLLVIAGVELGFMQRLLESTSLTAPQWLLCIGLAIVLPIVIELKKLVVRRRLGRSRTPCSPRRRPSSPSVPGPEPPGCQPLCAKYAAERLTTRWWEWA